MIDYQQYATELEERVAFAEQARDNAIAQRDAALERAKRKSETAGKCIRELVSMVRTMMTWDCLSTRRVNIEARLNEILGKDEP